MTISPISAYKAATTPETKNLVSLGSENSGGKSFGDFLKNTINEKVNALHNFENAATGATTGQVNDLDLITAVNEADIQLQAFKVAWEKFLQKYETIVEKTTI